MIKLIPAKQLKPGDWILYKNANMNERVVDVETVRSGEIKVSHDYGNDGEPATSFWLPDTILKVSR